MKSVFSFERAKKTGIWSRIGVFGASGGGKTWSSLVLARRMAEETGSRIAFIDTEHGSSAKYSHVFDFDILRLPPPYSPERYIEAMTAAADAGYQVVIVDTISHEWQGPGGILDARDAGSHANKFTDWAKLTPRHDAFVEQILSYPGHIICCMRAKTQYDVNRNDGGKSVPKKLGMGPIQRDGIEYNFDLVLAMDSGGYATISKSRLDTLRVESDVGQVTPDLAEIILDWCQDAVPISAPVLELLPLQQKFLDKYADVIGGTTKGDLDRFLGYTVHWPTDKTGWTHLVGEIDVEAERRNLNESIFDEQTSEAESQSAQHV